MKIARSLLDQIVDARPPRRPRRVLRPRRRRDGARRRRCTPPRTSRQPAALRDRRDGALPGAWTSIEDGGAELGAIYHSHTRSAPYPSQTDINFAGTGRASSGSSSASPATSPRSRSYRDRRRQGHRGRAGGRVSLVCPAAAREHADDERFCARCGMPLVAEGGPRRGAWSTSARERARKIKPQYTEGELVRVAVGRHQPEAELIQSLLLEEGVPSTLRRTRGFDVPEMLAAGPRDVLVPAVGRRDRARGAAPGRDDPDRPGRGRWSRPARAAARAARRPRRSSCAIALLIAD